MPLNVTVVGSINVDLVARVERLPRPGETLGDAEFARVPGGKGANQAVAAARLGAAVEMFGRVGEDDFGREAIAALRDAGVGTDHVRVVDAPTGVALIVVTDGGENQIVVAPGANARLRLEDDVPVGDLVLCQLEIPIEAVAAAFEPFCELRCLNASPARPVPQRLLDRAGLVVVNEHEVEALGEVRGYLAVTRGAEGAVLYRRGRVVARATPPPIEPVDGTAAGDAFCASLACDLAGDVDPSVALRNACAAGALAASRFGAQPSLPTAAEVEAILAG